MNSMKIVGAVVGFLIGIAVLSFWGRGVSFFENSFFGPREKALERNIYQQTPSYINGNLADLRNLRDQINREKDSTVQATEKAALRDKINNLPPDFPIPSDVQAAAN